MPGRTGYLKVAALRPFMENHVFILHEKVPVQRPGLQEIAGTYIPAHQVRQFQPLGFSENLMPISIKQSLGDCFRWSSRFSVFYYRHAKA